MHCFITWYWKPAESLQVLIKNCDWFNEQNVIEIYIFRIILCFLFFSPLSFTAFAEPLLISNSFFFQTFLLIMYFPLKQMQFSSSSVHMTYITFISGQDVTYVQTLRSLVISTKRMHADSQTMYIN